MKRTMLVVIGLIISTALFSASVSTNIRSGNMYYNQFSSNADNTDLRDKAIKYYNEALEKEPDLPEVIFRLAKLKIKVLKEKYPNSDETSPDYYNKLLELRPMYEKVLKLLNNLPEDKKPRKKALKTMHLKEKKVSDPRPGGEKKKISIVEFYELQSQDIIDLGIDAAVLNVANTLNNEGKTDEAVTAIETLLKVNPQYDKAIVTYARISYNAGNYEESIANYKKYLELKPDDVDVQRELAETYVLLLEDDPADKTDYAELSGKYIKKENLRNAVKIYKNLLTFGRNSNTEYFLGMYYLSLGEDDNAIEYLKKAISNDEGVDPVPFVDQACFTLSYIYQTKKKDDKNSVLYLQKGVDFQLKNEDKENVKIEIFRLKSLASNLFKADKFAEAESYADVLFNKAVDTPSKNLAKTIGNQSALKLKDSALSKKWSSR